MDASYDLSGMCRKLPLHRLPLVAFAICAEQGSQILTMKICGLDLSVPNGFPQVDISSICADAQ